MVMLVEESLIPPEIPLRACILTDNNPPEPLQQCHDSSD